MKRAAEMPTGSSTSSGSNGRRDSLVTSMRPVAGSPTVTRTGSTCVRMATCVRPTASSTENSSRARAAAAIISHSVQPIAAPTTQPVTPRASTAQPSGDTHRSTPTTGCHAVLSLGTPMAGRDGSRPALLSERRVVCSAVGGGTLMLRRLARRGGATSARIWLMTWSTVTLENCASAVSRSRWHSTGLAMSLMSSGITWVRPWLAAHVLAQRTKARQPRIDRPSLRLGCLRDSSARRET